jgi:hypothetical protein
MATKQLREITRDELAQVSSRRVLVVHRTYGQRSTTNQMTWYALRLLCTYIMLLTLAM